MALGLEHNLYLLVWWLWLSGRGSHTPLAGVCGGETAMGATKPSAPQIHI